MKSEHSDKDAPQALRDVQEWKASVWEDMEDLPFAEAVQTIARRAHQTAIDFGFHTVATPAHSMQVAETGGAYGAKGDL